MTCVALSVIWMRTAKVPAGWEGGPIVPEAGTVGYFRILQTAANGTPTAALSGRGLVANWGHRGKRQGAQLPHKQGVAQMGNSEPADPSGNALCTSAEL